MAQVGTLSIDDLYAVDDANVIEFGEDRVAEALQRDLANFRDNVEEMTSEVAMFTAQRTGRYGAGQASEMMRLDEYGSAATEKQRLAGEVALPLHKFGKATGWTRDFMIQSTPKELAEQQVMIQKGYLTSLRNSVRNSIFLSANYTVRDNFVNKTNLTIRRLVNADGEPIPSGPNGETFDGSTETHYLAVSGLTQTALEDAIDDVVEHGHGEDVRVYINKGDESGVRGFADFKPYTDARIINQEGTARQDLDQSTRNDRAIGLLNGAEIWVKPWMPANYLFTFAAGDEPPVNIRQHPQPSLRGLRLDFEHENAVMRADQYRAYMGAGVWTRTNGAVLHVGNSTYQEPSFIS